MRITDTLILSFIGTVSASKVAVRGGGDYGDDYDKGYGDWKPKTKEPHFFQLKVDDNCYKYPPKEDCCPAPKEGCCVNARPTTPVCSTTPPDTRLECTAPLCTGATGEEVCVICTGKPECTDYYTPDAGGMGKRDYPYPDYTYPYGSGGRYPYPYGSGSGSNYYSGSGGGFGSGSGSNYYGPGGTYHHDFCFEGYAIRLNKGQVIATPYNKWYDAPLATFFVDDDTQLYTVSKKPLQLYIDAVTGALKYTKVGWLPPNAISISFYHTGDNPNGIVNGYSPSLLTWPSTPYGTPSYGEWLLCPQGTTGQFTIFVNDNNFEPQGVVKSGCFYKKLAAVNANPWKKKSGKHWDDDYGYGYDDRHDKYYDDHKDYDDDKKYRDPKKYDDKDYDKDY